MVRSSCFVLVFSIEAIQIPTVSFSESNQNTSGLQEFDLLLRRGERLIIPKTLMDFFFLHVLHINPDRSQNFQLRFS